MLLLRADEDTGTVVCALCHDVGVLLSHVCHREIGDQFKPKSGGATTSAWGVDPDLREAFSKTITNLQSMSKSNCNQ